MSIAKQTYTQAAPKRRRIAQQSAMPDPEPRFDEVDVLEPLDNLPDEVDLSILEDVPRQRTASVGLFICPLRYMLTFSW